MKKTKKINIGKTLQKAITAHQSNNLQKAEKLYRQILEIEPEHSDANHNLGILATQVKRPDVAIGLFENAIRSNPNHPQYRKSLEGAKEMLKQLSTDPKAQANSKLDELLKQRKYNDAINIAKSAIERDPNYTYGWKVIGSIFFMFKDHLKALPYLEKAIELKPDDIETLNSLAIVTKALNKPHLAKEHLLKAKELNPDYVNTYYNLGNLLRDTGEIEEAKNTYRKALELDPKYVSIYNNLGNLLKDTGENEEATSIYQKGIELDPSHLEMHRSLSSITKYTDKTPHLDQLLKSYENSNTRADKYHLSFALAKAYEDIGDIDTSFKYLSEANRLKSKEQKFNIDTEIKLLNFIRSFFKDLESDLLKKEIDPSDKQPIFIIGMPRSGTTLVEQILSSHSNVYGCGELDHLRFAFRKNIILEYDKETFSCDNALLDIYRDFINEVKKVEFKEDIFTDKMPQNFRFIGAVLEAFPNAKIVHIKRDPISVCWSMYKNYFPAEGLGYSYDFKDLGVFYKSYEEMMEFWHELYPDKIYDLQYESLIDDQNGETKKLLEYCELDWEDSVLEPHKNKRAVFTTSSQQIRKKVYKGSNEAWKKYENYLEPLKKELEKKGKLLD